MTITAIRLAKDTYEAMGIGFCELPLDKSLDMRGIGQTVVLAGPNGAGKSRLLRLLQKLISKRLTADTRAGVQHQAHIQSGCIESRKKEIASIDKDIPLLASQLRDAEISLSNHQTELARLNALLRWDECMDVNGSTTPSIVHFVPKTPRLDNPTNLTPNNAAARADQCATQPENAHSNAPAYAAQIIRVAEQKGYRRLKDGSPHSTAGEESLSELRSILKQLLGLNFSLELDDQMLEIGGEKNFSDALSPGQQILFQFGCLLHANKAKLDNCIVVMDEPENHLHPGVLAQVVAALQSYLAGGQLWIATHSVPLIAQLLAHDNNCLWYVSEGQVKRSGRSPEKVLESLMGGPEGTKHLHDLTLLPTQYAAIQFLSECLDAPGVVGADIKDPQTNDIAAILRRIFKDKKANGQQVRVLDFGAGKGRLLATLRENTEDAMNWLDYYAYDIDADNQADCAREIAAAYPNENQPRWFKDLHDLEAQTRTDAFDVVVMCNVLHEINPDQWLPLLSASGTLSKLMREHAQLLIVEDYGIPVGERAHDYGFLLLNEHELCVLFDLTQKDRTDLHYIKQTSSDPRYKERLTAHLISKTCVCRISGPTQIEAIKKLRDRMTDTVSTTLKQENSANSDAGRTYARSAQLMVNATLWLRVHS